MARKKSLTETKKPINCRECSLVLLRIDKNKFIDEVIIKCRCGAKQKITTEINHHIQVETI